ncbi:hypothetical protein, partial [Streptomyces sp. IBSBF 2390]|uniref:hypothetical protein n=1 Tax=Streptomyces sp. IBSBF 2390 TaxID=2903533 RepID=UPI002FDC4A88
RKGELHLNADSLSRRLYCTKAEAATVGAIRLQPALNWTNENLRKAQEDDSEISKILSWMEVGTRPELREIASENR